MQRVIYTANNAQGDFDKPRRKAAVMNSIFADRKKQTHNADTKTLHSTLLTRSGAQDEQKKSSSFIKPRPDQLMKRWFVLFQLRTPKQLCDFQASCLRSFEHLWQEGILLRKHCLRLGSAKSGCRFSLRPFCFPDLLQFSS